jgi:hypothetical protein
VDGTVVLAHGDVRHDDFRNENRLQANELAAVTERVPGLLKSVQWVLRPEASAEEFLQLLAKEVRDHPGTTSALIAFQQDDGRVLEFELPNSSKLRLDLPIYHQLRKHAAVAGVVVEASPPPVQEQRWPRKNAMN